MGFSEKVKLKAKIRSAFRCCICQKLFIEIHHIIPSSEGGPDTLDNAAPLCASCHDLFGGNPEKRKQIKQMRDAWWKLVAKRNRKIIQGMSFDSAKINEDPEKINQLKNQYILIYYCVLADESFEVAAQRIFLLIKRAQQEFPNQNRVIALDIEGHRNEKGGFDNDMLELQTKFIIGMLNPFWHRVYLPMGYVVENPKLQRNDLATEIHIFSEEDSPTLHNILKEFDKAGIFMAKESKWKRIA